MARDISAEIDALTDRRAALWAEGGHAEEVKGISAKLATLYEEKRIAAAGSGTQKQRSQTIKKAVAERELDRLMT